MAVTDSNKTKDAVNQSPKWRVAKQKASQIIDSIQRRSHNFERVKTNSDLTTLKRKLSKLATQANHIFIIKVRFTFSDMSY